MQIINTIILCFIGLIVFNIIYSNYLEKTCLENFETIDDALEEEAREDLEELQVPTDPLYDEPTAEELASGQLNSEESKLKNQQFHLATAQSQDVAVESFTNNNKKKNGFFTTFLSFFYTPKDKKEGFADVTHTFTGPDGKDHSFTVDKPSFPSLGGPPGHPGSEYHAVHYHRRGRRSRRHRNRRRNNHRERKAAYYNRETAWRTYWDDYHLKMNTYNTGMSTYNAKVIRMQEVKEAEIRAAMEVARRSAITKEVKDKWTKVGGDITNVKGVLADYKTVKQSDDNRNKVIKEAGTRLTAAVGTRLVNQGQQNPAWETELSAYHRGKVPSYYDQFNWSADTTAPNQYIGTQKQYRLRENRIAENTNTRNAHWPTVDSEMNKLLKPYYSNGKIPSSILSQIEIAYGKQDDPYYWTLDKYKNRALDKIAHIKAGKDNEKTKELILLRQQAAARQASAISARDQAQIEMNAQKSLAVEMNKVRIAAAAEFAKAQAARSEQNNKLVKNMSGTMNKRLLTAASSQKALKEYEQGPMRIAANSTMLNIRGSQRALQQELQKQRGTRQFLQDAKMENIREISLRARQNYDEKLNARLK